MDESIQPSVAVTQRHNVRRDVIVTQLHPEATEKLANRIVSQLP